MYLGGLRLRHTNQKTLNSFLFSLNVQRGPPALPPDIMGLSAFPKPVSQPPDPVSKFRISHCGAVWFCVNAIPPVFPELKKRGTTLSETGGRQPSVCGNSEEARAIRRYFSLDLPAWVFLRNVLGVSAVVLILAVSVYVALTPGLAGMVLGGGEPLIRFFRQVMTNGLPVVFVVNFAGFFLFVMITQPGGSPISPGVAIAIDLVVRAGLFVAVHALTYVLSADFFGSFGGERATALRVVGPTLVNALWFDNISGAYLYAVALSAVPVHAMALIQMPRLAKRGVFSLQVVTLCVVFVIVFMALVTMIAAAMIW